MAASALDARIAALDALRGLAVAGIAVMNVLVFALPAQAYVNPAAWGGTGLADTLAWLAAFLLVEDKFRNLFAMLFGAGVAMLIARPGPRPLAGHFARMAVLFAIGFVHALTLANNDVLRLYAIAGLFLPLFLRFGVRNLLLIAGGLVIAQLAVAGYFAWGWLDYWWQWRTGEVNDFAPLVPAEYAFGAHPDGLAQAIERGRESFAGRIERRMGNLAGPLRTAGAAIPSTLAAMLVGIAMLKTGLLNGQWPRARLLRLARWTIGVALPGLALLAAANMLSDFAPVVTAANALVFSAPFDLLLAIGWAALAMAVFARHQDHPLTRRLAAAGRMALTNYIATSIVFAAIFASWGLGLSGSMSRAQAMAVSFIPIALMLALSPAWLMRFRQGPLEWLWRRTSGNKPAALRR